MGQFEAIRFGTVRRFMVKDINPVSKDEECRKAFEDTCRFMQVEFSLEWDSAGFYAQLETDTCFTWFKLGFDQAKTSQVAPAAS
jgi:hypothetical protein